MEAQEEWANQGQIYSQQHLNHTTSLLESTVTRCVVTCKDHDESSHLPEYQIKFKRVISL